MSRGVAGALLAAALIAGPVRAPEAKAAPAPARSDSTAAPSAARPDSTRASATAPADTSVAAPADTAQSGIRLIGSGRAARDTTVRRVSRFDTPRWVMLRSLVIPGWGQWTNGSWFKALAVAGVEIGLGVAMANDARELDRLLGDVDAARAAKDPEAELHAVDAYNDRQSTLVAREWLFGGALAYALMDAYVDAHFRRFKVEFGKPRPQLDSRLPGSARLSLGWAF